MTLIDKDKSGKENEMNDKDTATYHIKNGIAAHDKKTKMTAHGYNKEVAIENLKHTVELYYRALNRGKTK